MGRTVSIGNQSFEDIREKNSFYVDKTGFIKEWWENLDTVTLITRPRRFGKTLNMNMLDCFFSNKYADRSDLFEGLDIWNKEKYRELQGTFPVISLTFAGVKGKDYDSTVKGIKKEIAGIFDKFDFLRKFKELTENELKALEAVSENMNDVDAEYSLKLLSTLLHKYYKKKVLIFLDEYDTPMQEAYVNGYWEELTAFIRSMFNNTFKTNPSLDRAVLTGITRVSKESIFSDLNNLEVITTTSNKYETCFGFTEEEVFAAMDEQGIDPAQKENVKKWYDGFTFGKVSDIYNPWSIISYLDKKEFNTYWANTSSNGLIGKLIREGDENIKTEFEKLLSGEYIEAKIDEQIVFSQLSENIDAIWSLLLASGYLKVLEEVRSGAELQYFRLIITNFEVKQMFYDLIENWFKKSGKFTGFVKALFTGDEIDLTEYLNDLMLRTFSSFDVPKDPDGKKEPERFYHGLVLGLIVDRNRDYMVKSNRESGYGRYDVTLEPKDIKNKAVIIEFKVLSKARGEKTLEDTAANALKQIEDKKYDTDLLSRGIPKENILKYGFAFEGEQCLIKRG